MKFIISLCAAIFMVVCQAIAADNYLEDVRTLGYVSGEGLACGAERYPSYELVARAFLVSSARSDKEQADGMYAYNSAKARAYMNKRREGLMGCEEVKERFNKLKIFNAALYKDGRIKMPDGKLIKPRQKYDPRLLYNRNEDERSRLNAYYDKLQEKKKRQAQKEGIFKKIREEELKSQYR
ncbi:MAG: hypothetical protein NC218_04805 [Acetobacter sp.]|nr:hypothetical protein [Acetobacter sp.]